MPNTDKPLTMESLLASLPKREPRHVDIDVSHILGRPVVFTFREPPIDWDFVAWQIDKDQIKRRQPFWCDLFCVMISLLGQTHVAPPMERPPAEVYIELADKQPHLVRYLQKKLLEAFPEINLDAEIEQQKKA